MLRRFIVFSFDHRLRARCQRAHTWNAGAEAPRERQRSFSDRNRACRRHQRCQLL